MAIHFSISSSRRNQQARRQVFLADCSKRPVIRQIRRLTGHRQTPESGPVWELALLRLVLRPWAIIGVIALLLIVVMARMLLCIFASIAPLGLSCRSLSATLLMALLSVLLPSMLLGILVGVILVSALRVLVHVVNAILL